MKKLPILMMLLAGLCLSACTESDKAGGGEEPGPGEPPENPIGKPEPLPVPDPGAAPKVEQIYDPALLGTWNSDCLTPDANSPWSEQHTFTFTQGMTATHIRVSYEEGLCGGSMTTMTTEYRYVINGNPEKDAGKVIPINLTMANNGVPMEGMTIYDIYQISGNTLMLGHGFRNNMSYVGAESGGASEATRISTLNQYIVYRK